MPGKAYKNLSNHLDKLYDEHGLSEENREKWVRFVCDELKSIAEMVDSLEEIDEEIRNELDQKNLDALSKITTIQSETKLCLSEMSGQLSNRLNDMYRKLIDAINSVNLKVTSVGAKYGAIATVILNVILWVVIYILKDHIFK